MSNANRTYWSDKVARGEPIITRFLYQITGTKTISQLEGNASYPSFDAISTQAKIDTFLGTTSEFNYLAFDATSMGTDTWGAIIDMQGQVASLLYVQVMLSSGTGGVTTVFNKMAPLSTLTNTTNQSECALGANGNVALKFLSTGLDSVAAGFIEVTLAWRAN
jgi:hypothetical protein